MLMRFLILFYFIISTSCVHQKVQDRSKKKYKPFHELLQDAHIRYKVKEPKNLRYLDTHSVSVQGNKGIDYLLWSLYRDLNKYQNRSPSLINRDNSIFLSGLDFKNYVTKIKATESYQECTYDRNNKKNCETKYRTVDRYVLISSVSVNVYK